jgi:hypothetical protein
MNKIYDAIVIGGGASGMTAAICAAADVEAGLSKKNNKNILLLEKNKKIGKKLYATGNGKCNISNSYFGFDCYDSEYEFFPYQIMTKDSYITVNNFINQLGVKTVSENGYYYPASLQASTVVWAMADKLKELGVEIHTSEQAVDIVHNVETGAYTVKTDSAKYETKNIVFACGGAAAPELGGTDSGYELMDKLNIKCIPPYPSLCKLKCREDISMLAGVRAKARVSLYVQENKPVRNQNKSVNRAGKIYGKAVFCREEAGEVQFTKDYLSGIVIFNLSHMAGRYLRNGEKVFVRISLLPDMEQQDIDEYIKQYKVGNSSRTVMAMLNGLVNEKLSAYIMQTLNIENKTVSMLSQSECDDLSLAVNNLTFEITGTGGFDSSQVTAGGVTTRCIIPVDMSFFGDNHIYIIGELLDVDGKCGGYNLMWAIITGMRAGSSIYNK